MNHLGNISKKIQKQTPTVSSKLASILKNNKSISPINKTKSRSIRHSKKFKSRSKKRWRKKRRARAGITLQPGVTRQVGVDDYN